MVACVLTVLSRIRCKSEIRFDGVWIKIVVLFGLNLMSKIDLEKPLVIYILF